MREGSARNPYDFRSPVRTTGLLAGREDEVSQIDEFLRGAATGSPSHFALSGPPGMGKSSLLNGVVQIARRRQLLPAKLDLRETSVESPLAFYAAVFDAALKALLDLGAIDTTHPVVHNWTQHTLLGVAELPSDPDSYLSTGLLVAARMAGKVVEDISTPVLQQDVDAILQLGATENLRGLVIAMDSAELLDDNADIAPSLMQLSEATTNVSLVTASEELGSLQENAPRAWAQIELRPYTSVYQILDAIMRPLVDAEELDFAPTFRTATDIQELTEG